MDIARELKTLWNIKVIPIVIGVLRTISKSLERRLEKSEIGGWAEPSKLHFWSRSEYWEESWKPQEICSYLDSSERPSAKACVKNSQGIIIMVIYIYRYIYSEREGERCKYRVGKASKWKKSKAERERGKG